MAYVVSSRPGLRIASPRILRAAALSAAIGGVLISVATQVRVASGPPPAVSAGGQLSPLEGVPMMPQATISTGGDADAAFAPHVIAGGYRLTGAGVSGVIGSRGLVALSGASSVSLTNARIGRGTALRPLSADPSAAPLSIAGRVVLRGDGASEWFAAGSLGIEQGFTLTDRPTGPGSTLTISTTVGGSLAADMTGTRVVFRDRGGRVVLTYGGLSASDATGRSLRAWLTLSGRRLLLRVDDRGARYPLRIDPLVEQQKISPTDSIVEPDYGSYFGSSVAISANGNTALVGGPNDGPIDNLFLNPGAVWVYARTGSTWTEQQKLVPPDEIGGESDFGASVSLSGDGTTALIGGYNDNSNGFGAIGAAWVYKLSGGTWTELEKIVPGDASGDDSDFGLSVALSGDGSTALIGGVGDGSDSTNHYSNTGAAWIYTLSGGTYTELQKIVPDDESEPCGLDAGDPTSSCSNFGSSVALSQTGSTALIGGPTDNVNGGAGAAWVYTLSGGTYTELQKIAPTDNLGSSTDFGNAAALSADGSTALIGGDNDNNVSSNSDAGAAWVYALSGASYAEQQKIVPSDETGAGFPDPFGWSVALSGDGNTALIGSPFDSSEAPTCDDDGAAWLYSRSGTAWSEQQKIVPSDEDPCGSDFGSGVALSQNASTALIGGDSDDTNGAAWTYASGSNDADLSVSISAPATAVDGTSFQATVTVDNQGPAVATSVRTTLLVPLALKVTNGDGASGLGPLRSWIASSIPPLGEESYTVTLQVRAHANRPVKLIALTRSPTEPDPNLTNNTATSPIALGPAAASERQRRRAPSR